MDALAVLRQVRTSETRIRDAYLRRDSWMEDIRTSIYQTSTVERDYFLAADAGRRIAQRKGKIDRWHEIRLKSDGVIQAYALQTDAADVRLFNTLKEDLASYWQLGESIFSRAARGPYNPEETRDRRRSMLAVVDRLDDLHAQHLRWRSARSSPARHRLSAVLDDAKLSATFDQLRWRLLAVLAACVLVGVLLAGFTLRRTMRWEAEIEARYMEGVRARQEAQELSARLLSAQEEERRAISRELHDEVGQSLSALLMEAGHAAASVPSGAVEVRRHVDSIKRLAEASVQVIRNMTLLLRPSMLDDFGLVPALEWQAREVETHSGFWVLVTSRGERKRTSGRAQDLYLPRGSRGAAQLRSSQPGASGEGGSAPRRFPHRAAGGGRRQGFRRAARARAGTGGHGRTRAPPGRRISCPFTARRRDATRSRTSAGPRASARRLKKRELKHGLYSYPPGR